ncbi:hypothetical protein HPP92_024473 [Vanilla planifolia]|uniref:Glycosyl transferase family 1 domain-containing protein n=1 Tax=Vanilla planifolia TaxID=51239 RepID=A0A835PJQ2_VANPL|nr:hypothetical protein HPP92_024473 [Vanilla planifolia]
MRLVYRKGTDLLVEVIHKCQLHPNVRFVIGGDGLNRVRLEEMREKSLQDKVEMLGLFTYSSAICTCIWSYFLEQSQHGIWSVPSQKQLKMLPDVNPRHASPLSQMWGMGWQAVLLSYDHQFAMAAVGNDGRVDKTRE